MSKKKPVRPASVSGQLDGDYDGTEEFTVMKTEKRVRTVIAADGVEETQVDYVPMSDVIMMGRLGDKYDEIDWTK